METKSYTCQKCNKTMNEMNFFTYKDGRKTELCKKCMTMHIDNFDESTFLWLLEKMDVPYIEAEWRVLRDRAFAKDPYKMNGASVFGKYIAKMKLKQFKDYGWADTERLKAESEGRAKLEAEERKRHEEIVKLQYENGEISEAEYKTMVSVDTQREDFNFGAPPSYVSANNFYDEKQFVFSPEEIPDATASLTHEDKLYLAMKWGRLYKPDEWIALEKNYNEMMNSFDIQDADTINTLILLCRLI